jgi:glutamate formiminotransferase
VTLLAVPNVSEGRDAATIEAIGTAFKSEAGARLLDVHSDPDHHRSVFTLAGEPGSLAEAVLAGARESLARVDLSAHDGIHPRVGAIDVAPIVYLEPRARGAAAAEALVLANLLGERLGVPVLMYGEIAGGRTRAELRRGGPEVLANRLAAGELRPDFGPLTLDPRRGAVLVAARPPLVAFNVELGPGASLEQAREIAALIREGGGEGLPTVRAIGLWLGSAERAQVSTNIDDYTRTAPLEVVAAIARHADPVAAELVGLAPRAAFEGFPEGVPVRNLRLIEDAVS